MVLWCLLRAVGQTRKSASRNVEQAFQPAYFRLKAPDRCPNRKKSRAKRKDTKVLRFGSSRLGDLAVMKKNLFWVEYLTAKQPSAAEPQMDIDRGFRR